MAFTPLTAERAEATQALLRQQFKTPDQSLANVSLATDLYGSRFFSHRNFEYEVKPLPYQAGIRLENYRLKLDKLIKQETDDDPEKLIRVNDETERLLKEVSAYLKTLVIPVFKPQRWLWRWLTNPFEKASGTDLITLLYFFCECRMRSAVRLDSNHQQAMETSRSSTMRLMT